MAALSDYGIELSASRPGNYKAKCPKCAHLRKRSNQNDRPLSITIAHDGGAVWNCHNCEWADGFSGTGGRRERYEKKTYRRPAPPRRSDPMDKALAWLATRGISPQTAADFELFVTARRAGDEDHTCLAFPYRVDGELWNVKYRTGNKIFLQEKDAERSLFNIDRVKEEWAALAPGEKKILRWVEGEMDVLAAHEAGLVTVSLPDGAPKEARFEADDKRFAALQAHPWLSEADLVIVATDADSAGEALAEELVHRFGKDRCARVQWPETFDVIIKDANECLMEHGEDSLVEAFSRAVPYPVEGLYSADHYLPMVMDMYYGRVAEPVSTGFHLLDQIYKVMPGTFSVVTGIPNHGKSNFLDQILVNLAKNEGWGFAVFSPETTGAMHMRKLAEKMARLPFEEGPNRRMTESELRRSMEKLGKHFWLIEARDAIPSVDWLLEKARAAVLRYGVKGLVIDPYNEVDAARKSGVREDEHVRDLILRVKRFCQHHDVAAWMVAHPYKLRPSENGTIQPPGMYEISGAAHWNNMADVGLVVHRDFDAGTTSVITRKIREQEIYGTIGECIFKYSGATRSYYEAPLTEQTSLWAG